MPTECTPEYCTTICAEIAYWAADMSYTQAAHTYASQQYYFWQGEKYRCNCSCGEQMMSSPVVTSEDVANAKSAMDAAAKNRDAAKERLDKLKSRS